MSRVKTSLLTKPVRSISGERVVNHQGAKQYRLLPRFSSDLLTKQQSAKKRGSDLHQLFTFGFMWLADIALTHGSQGRKGINTRIVPITPFEPKGIPSHRLNIFK